MPLPSCTDTVDIHTNASRGLANHGAVLEGVIDTLDGIVLHADQKARAQLRARSTGIEKSR